MKFSDIMTAKAMEEIAQQAEANAVATFEDVLWSSMITKADAIFKEFNLVGTTKAVELMTMLHDIAESAYQAGAVIGAQQSIIVFLKTIKDSEL